ncbi:hypothetical protein E8E11_009431 [Didymella keratinophila]|nr:hypothetical protein E8E11_009431 [Didymella keratinophila]
MHTSRPARSPLPGPFPPLPTMFDYTAEDWITLLEKRAMQRFQVFTNRIIAALRQDDDTSEALMQHDRLQRIYNGLPCFYEQATFHQWVKDATMKHPGRRTAKQYQWVRIVDQQEAAPTEYIVQMVKQAVLSLKRWKVYALDVDMLAVDPND